MLQAVRDWTRPKPPRHIAERFRRLDEPGLARLRQSLAEHVGGGVGDQQRMDDDFLNHLHRRLDGDRMQVIPWLDSVRPLQGARVLEIGCGTGSSTVALAEQGARVTAIDVHHPSVQVAAERCALHGVEARLEVANASQAAERFGQQAFDLVIFYASLEHMLYAERLAAMRATWEMLPPGGLWCVIEAPNRLWYRDNHTAHLDFFGWLPDELAVAYGRFSPRDDVRSALSGLDGRQPADQQALIRLGRAVSYHEFDLAIQPAEELQVVSSLADFKRRDRLLWLRWRASFDYRYQALLWQRRPNVHRGFFEPNLDLLIRKG